MIKASIRTLAALLVAAAIAVHATSLHSASAGDLEELLDEKLWTSRDAYDAAHVLMIPMIDAYQSGNEELIERYRGFMSRFIEDREKEELGKLTKLQFNYLVSRFTLLETSRSGCSVLGRAALSHVATTAESVLTSPAWLWKMPDFPSMFERAEWKLSQADTNPSYLRAFFDEEFFAFATAADVVTASRRCDLEPSDVILKAAEIGRKIFLTQGRFDEKGWVFQPGVWRDHPDYAYAGNLSIGPDLKKVPVDSIGGDSSHAARMPLIINSFICSVSNDEQAAKNLSEISNGLSEALMAHVIIMPSEEFMGIRLKNYMTGENGVYRYSYGTVGKNGGYGPYSLSGTFNFGWWSVLGHPLSLFYKAQLENLPFGDDAVTLYLGPVVTDGKAPRARHPKFAPSEYLKGELVRTVLSAAARVAERGVSCS
ncbi:MAG: hypothetical protein WBF87_04510 [Mesorhizobium sp.]